MVVKTIVGTQFGDEGKGKITDFFAGKADLVVRYHGGNNAGHTVVVGEKVYKFHLLPSGLVQGKKCCIAAGVVLDPRVLKEELERLDRKKIELTIDPRVQIIMPWHNLLDGAMEKMLGQKKIGTTGRGIGPCYEDRAARLGIRFMDLVDGERLKKKISEIYPVKKKIIENVYGEKVDFSEEQVFEEYAALGKEFKPFLEDVSVEVSKAIKEGKEVLFEGAQGFFLDNDFGTYPYVTSSHPMTGGVFTGVGIAPFKESEAIGIAKAYTTRVGSGPFVTELDDELGEQIRKNGNEFGTTTGRPRRVGWLDLVLLRTSTRVNGLTNIVLTKIDVLSGIDELKVCVAYECDGKELKEFPFDLEKLERCKPVYKTFKGFEMSQDAKTLEELPAEVIEYADFVEKELGVKVGIISVGPKRSQTILR